MARPEIYTEEIAKELCYKISTSNKSLKTICKELEISVKTVLNWLNDETKAEFLRQYARAKEEQADFLAEEMIEIADDSSQDNMTITGPDGKLKVVEDREWTNRSRLRVDTRKWIASKLKPKKYGDKIDVTTQGQAITQVTITEKTRES